MTIKASIFHDTFIALGAKLHSTITDESPVNQLSDLETNRLIHSRDKTLFSTE